jgi:hypothetical protein
MAMSRRMLRVSSVVNGVSFFVQTSLREFWASFGSQGEEGEKEGGGRGKEGGGRRKE